ncbi:MAG: hypothetical protein CEE38_22000 [Planctomycetes bacterium B3_Pla]|nr:MAG: hypothetical protein CEE38_22000 [Planctomycetes bacterium B3_Pla]
MPKKILKILAVNPGSKYIGIAVFEGPELEDWRVKVIKDKWSKEKLQQVKTLVRSYIERYEPGALAIKRLHRSRSSANLNQLIGTIKQLSKRKGLKICEYSIKDLETFFYPEGKTNKRKLAEVISSKYPALSHEFKKERTNKNSYYIRMFEAVAIGAVCSHELDK